MKERKCSSAARRIALAFLLLLEGCSAEPGADTTDTVPPTSSSTPSTKPDNAPADNSASPSDMPDTASPPSASVEGDEPLAQLGPATSDGEPDTTCYSPAQNPTLVAFSDSSPCDCVPEQLATICVSQYQFFCPTHQWIAIGVTSCDIENACTHVFGRMFSSAESQPCDDDAQCKWRLQFVGDRIEISRGFVQRDSHTLVCDGMTLRAVTGDGSTLGEGAYDPDTVHGLNFAPLS